MTQAGSGVSLLHGSVCACSTVLTTLLFVTGYEFGAITLVLQPAGRQLSTISACHLICVVSYLRWLIWCHGLPKLFLTVIQAHA